ncbi:hypothetical protein Tco_0484763, partial [Tanacetum coccineum]
VRLWLCGIESKKFRSIIVFLATSSLRALGTVGAVRKSDATSALFPMAPVYHMASNPLPDWHHKMWWNLLEIWVIVGILSRYLLWKLSGGDEICECRHVGIRRRRRAQYLVLWVVEHIVGCLDSFSPLVKDYYLHVFTIEKPENKTDAKWTILHRQGIINQLACMGIKFEDEIQGCGFWQYSYERKREERHKVLLHSQMSWSHKGGGEVKAEARVTEVIIVVVLAKENLLMLNVIIIIKKGHTMKFCRQLKKENKKKNYNNQKNKHKKDDDGDDNTEVNTTTDEFFVCYDYDMVNLANDDSSWILNSGATCHVQTQKILYIYTPVTYGVVRMGNTGLSNDCWCWRIFA